MIFGIVTEAPSFFYTDSNYLVHRASAINQHSPYCCCLLACLLEERNDQKFCNRRQKVLSSKSCSRRLTGERTNHIINTLGVAASKTELKSRTPTATPTGTPTSMPLISSRGPTPSHGQEGLVIRSEQQKLQQQKLQSSVDGRRTNHIINTLGVAASKTEPKSRTPTATPTGTPTSMPPTRRPLRVTKVLSSGHGITCCGSSETWIPILSFESVSLNSNLY